MKATIRSIILFCICERSLQLQLQRKKKTTAACRLQLQQGRHSTADICRRRKKRETERTKRTKGNKKEKVRTAFLPWIPKGVLRTQKSNFVYPTKLQQKLHHSTTLVALVQLQIYSRGTRAAQELTYGQSWITGSDSSVHPCK